MDMFAQLKAHNVPAHEAQNIASFLTQALARKRPDQAWQGISRDFLTPKHPFALHIFLYEQCYGPNALLHAPGPMWIPTEEIIEASNIIAGVRLMNLPDDRAFYNWSFRSPGPFWGLVVDEILNIQLRTRPEKMLDPTNPTQPRWLIGAKLNIVDSCFQHDPAAPAIIESDGTSPLKTTTYAQLRALTNQVANTLTAAGIHSHHTVAMLGPITSTTVAAYLGIISTGATVVSIADSFSPEEIAARLRIANAKLIITQDQVPWGAKRLPLYSKVAAAANAIPILVISTGPQENLGMPLRKTDRIFQTFLSANTTFTPVERDPHDPINILFSSGTTGDPKAIPWDHTTPIKCAMDAHFHHDLHEDDITCWPTNLGWMMGPWLIFATFINKSTIAIFNQAPTDRPFGQFVQDAKVTMLGLVPSLVRAWRNSNCMQNLDWSNIKAFSSSGECSNPEDMLYLSHLANYKPIIEYCGGTEIGGAYITSTVVQPNIPAAFSTPALGIQLLIQSHNQIVPLQHPTTAQESQDQRAPISGEVFIGSPSIGLSTRLLNKDHDAIYFKDTPRNPSPNEPPSPLRRHGDELETLPSGYLRIAGRSDDTMNLGGIKVGCAEIERTLAAIPGILESAAVAIAPPGGGPSKLVIFTALKQGSTATPDALLPQMQSSLRTHLNPLFKIDSVKILPALPRTASNKILRRDLRKLS